MRYLFAQENVALLAQFAGARVLIGLDFDGTLAPIVRDRHAATMRSETRRLLERTCALYPCAIFSGRARPDLLNRLGAARAQRVVSNLGFEVGSHDAKLVQAIARLKPLLEAQLGALSGVEVEDKRYSLAIHYRRCRRKRDARATIGRVGMQLSAAFRVVPGKLVVNVVHARAPTKATALLHLREELRADTALYVGDDVSDEDVFELDQPGRLLALRVGRSRTSRAPYYLRDQREVDRLLRALVALRAQP
jgi:trehalose 6-phosphate phosphatase